jgi:predicted Zn-dependent protease
VHEVRALAALGRVEEVLQLLDRALALPPQAQRTPADVARIAAEELRSHGHPKAADHALARALTWYRTLPPGERTREAHRFGLAQALYRLGRWDQAEPLFRELSREFPDNINYLGYLGSVAARRRHAAEVGRISETLARMERLYLRGSNTFWRARIAAVAGRHEDAISLLSASFAQGQGYGLAVHAEPDFESLREHPEFQRLLRPSQ